MAKVKAVYHGHQLGCTGCWVYSGWEKHAISRQLLQLGRQHTLITGAYAQGSAQSSVCSGCCSGCLFISV